MPASCNLKRQYVFYQEQFRKNYSMIREAFEKRFSGFILSYSLKTNNSPQVLELLKSMDGWVEVVSPEEYSMVRNAGFDNFHIIYNGICKDRKSFCECAAGGGLVNIDNERDLQFALDYYEEKGEPLSLGLRISFDIGNHIKSHFGVQTGSLLYQRILDCCVEKKIELKALHCHFTQATELKFWKARAEGMCRAYAECRERGICIDWLDFGGNMVPASYGEVSMDQYAETVSSVIRDSSIDCGIILECGTPLVSDAFAAEGNVLCVKDQYVVVDLSIFNIGLAVTSDRCRIQIIPGEESDLQHGENCGHSGPKTIVGFTCMENDIIKKSWNGKVRAGDRIIVKDCGAYSYSWGCDFIKERLPVVIR